MAKLDGEQISECQGSGETLTMEGQHEGILWGERILLDHD